MYLERELGSDHPNISKINWPHSCVSIALFDHCLYVNPASLLDWKLLRVQPHFLLLQFPPWCSVQGKGLHCTKLNINCTKFKKQKMIAEDHLYVIMSLYLNCNENFKNHYY